MARGCVHGGGRGDGGLGRRGGGGGGRTSHRDLDLVVGVELVDQVQGRLHGGHLVVGGEGGVATGAPCMGRERRENVSERNCARKTLKNVTLLDYCVVANECRSRLWCRCT